jgi:sugar lactone lactonase YvrE
MRYAIITALALLSLACQAPKTESSEAGQTPVGEKKAPVTLSLKWQTDSLLTTCESVIYDKDNDVLYVANINGQPDGKDGNGFVSKVSLDGKITETQWVKGLDAPKGMGLYKGKLYVADIDKIREVEVSSGRLTKTYPVKDAKFLNDVTIDESGRVYVSDTGSGDIILLEYGAVTKWMSGVDSPNGLLAEGENMMMASFGGQTFNVINASKQVTLKNDSIENADGIEAVGDGGYLVSSWNGMVHYIAADGTKTLVLDTRADNISAADIEYIQDKRLLLVPTFFKNRVVAYEVTK